MSVIIEAAARLTTLCC